MNFARFHLALPILFHGHANFILFRPPEKLPRERERERQENKNLRTNKRPNKINRTGDNNKIVFRNNANYDPTVVRPTAIIVLHRCEHSHTQRGINCAFYGGSTGDHLPIHHRFE